MARAPRPCQADAPLSLHLGVWDAAVRGQEPGLDRDLQSVLAGMPIIKLTPLSASKSRQLLREFDMTCDLPQGRANRREDKGFAFYDNFSLHFREREQPAGPLE